jgi:membrane associated rhomboid family serine protease
VLPDAGNVGAMVVPTGVVSTRPSARVIPARPLIALTTMLAFTALLWGIEAYDQVTGQWLDADGIVPRSVDGLDGILWAPLLHGGWAHLIANTLPFLIFGFLVMAHGIGRFVAVTAVIWLLGGLGVWLTGAPGTVHIGMSGVIFGWLTYLLVRGFFARSGTQILLAVVLFFLWGGILLGVLPGQPGVSWQGHLFGALAGVLAAWLVARPARRAPTLRPGGAI